MQPINFLTIAFCFLLDTFRISLPGGSMWLTLADFTTQLTSLFVGKNVQEITLPSNTTSKLTAAAATLGDQE